MCQAFFVEFRRFPMQRVPHFFLENLCDMNHTRVILRQNIWIALVFGFLSGACGGGDETTKSDVTALDGGSISWRTWSQRDSARTLGRPILLFFYTQRSVWCRDLVARCFENSEIARAIARYTLPIWVDADQRPDLFERFGLGGVPSLAFLTPDGQWIHGQHLSRSR